jgi:uncharacterized lipoprotein YbaY
MRNRDDRQRVRATMIRSRWSQLTMLTLAAIAGAACPAWAGTLRGTATYRERLALPPDAVFEAVLQDVSLADAPATVLGRFRREPAGQPPFRFEIEYDDAAVTSRRRYAVRATVTHQGRLLFTTDRHYPVLDGGNAPLEMLLVSVGAGRRPLPRTGAERGAIDLPASYEGELASAAPSGGTWTSCPTAATSCAPPARTDRRRSRSTTSAAGCARPPPVT